MDNGLRLKQIEKEFLLSSDGYRLGSITLSGHKTILLNTIKSLLEIFDDYEPYMSSLREKDLACFRRKEILKQSKEEKLVSIKAYFLTEDRNLRLQLISKSEFNLVQREVLNLLFEAFDEIEPYYTEFREEAENIWIKEEKIQYRKLIKKYSR